jgi:hypothetical protein
VVRRQLAGRSSIPVATDSQALPLVQHRMWVDSGRAMIGAQRTLGLMYGVSKAVISRCLADQEKIEKACATKKGKHADAALGQRKEGKYPVMEKELMKLVVAAREKGLRVGRMFLKIKAMDLMSTMHHGKPFAASYGWSANFCKRQGLSYRKKTNKKELSTEERLVRIKR